MKTVISILLLFFITAGLSGQTFYDYYNEGLKSLKKENWEEAEQNFLKAIKLREHDEKRVRTYGVNFIDYFPNRELGIVYFERKDFDKARFYLERSQRFQPTGRADEYLARIGVTNVTTQQVIEEPSTQNDRTKPTIEILSPSQLSSGELNPVSNDTKLITIKGIIKDESGIYEVLVNGNDASISGSGEFRAEVPLRVGSNKILIVAKDVHQNFGEKEFTLVREEVVVSKNELLSEGGRYYALIIGVSDYEDPQIPDLDGLPIQDATRLSEILTRKYTFEEADVHLMKNPTRKEILRVFDWLSNVITDKDNLLIFYAGHGFYDERAELGYWLPADAEASFTAYWIYNDVLVANLKRIQSKHTLLVSDACFSGSIFKSRALINDAPTAFKKKYALKSRKAITSGVLKTVPNKSVFFKYFADRLDNNKEIYMSASQLFQSIEIPVANNSPNTPQYGDIQNVGDEGGDFIFIRRQGRTEDTQ